MKSYRPAFGGFDFRSIFFVTASGRVHIHPLDATFNHVFKVCQPVSDRHEFLADSSELAWAVSVVEPTQPSVSLAVHKLLTLVEWPGPPLGSNSRTGTRSWHGPSHLSDNHETRGPSL